MIYLKEPNIKTHKRFSEFVSENLGTDGEELSEKVEAKESEILKKLTPEQRECREAARIRREEEAKAEAEREELVKNLRKSETPVINDAIRHPF